MIIDGVRSYLANQAVRGPGAVLVALSGGPDSTALVHALRSLAGEHGLDLACAHLDHGIRPAPERRREREAVVDLAAALGLPLVTAALPPGFLEEQARRHRRSPEEAARVERYRFLAAARVLRGARWVALGHTADDVAETMLMRLLQGSGIAGLRGIPDRRGPWIRPLIRVERGEVLRYLSELGAEGFEDSTNRDPRYLRNAVRWELVPRIAALFPGYRAALAHVAGDAVSLDRFILDETRLRIPWTRSTGGVHADWTALRRAQVVIRKRAILEAMDLLGARRVPERHLASLGRPWDPDKRGVLLGGFGYRVERREDRVWVVPDIVRRGKIGYLLHVRAPGTYFIPRTSIVVEVASDWREGSRSLGSGPVVVRSRRPGERVPQAGAAFPPVPVVGDRSGVCRVLGSSLGGHDVAVDPGSDSPDRGGGITARVTMEEL